MVRVQHVVVARVLFERPAEVRGKTAQRAAGHEHATVKSADKGGVEIIRATLLVQ